MARITIYFFIVAALCNGFGVDGLKLKQVLVLSRHNIRTPLVERLAGITPYKWPVWSEENGYLTTKGILLEEYMGDYFSEWLKKEKLLPEECPSDESVFIYANTKQRTKETAKAFARAAFKNCNIHVHYKNISEMDPVFNPVIRNTSKEFKNEVVEEIKKKFKNLNLTEPYAELDRILDVNNSKMCKEDNFCSFVEAKNTLLFKINTEPDYKGPLNYGNHVVDVFLMSFYSGAPFEEIAWGKINSPEQFDLLLKITKADQNMRFNVTSLAKNVAKPLLHFISDAFLNGDVPFTFLAGHDSNLNSVLSAMEFKGYNLPNQRENTPPGGKIVFEKWYDEENDEYHAKVEFVYQTTEQLRDGKPLSMNDPPSRVVLELKDCPIDKNGFCLWSDFVKILGRFQ